jgi:DNA-binding GntR family transcriptional regulator
MDAIIPEPRPMKESGEGIARGLLRRQVTARILAGVFGRRLLPGSRLIVQQLSERYRVSPTPVRESLLELEGLGIVQLLPNRGAVVLPFGPQQVREIGQVRRVLEVEATRSACGCIADEELAALEHDLERVRSIAETAERARAGREVDSRLHGRIAAACGSARLATEIGRYITLFRVLRDVSHERDDATSSSGMPEQHLEIVRALRRRDAEEAGRAMDRHLRAVAETVTRVVFAATEARSPGRSASTIATAETS